MKFSDAVVVYKELSDIEKSVLKKISELYFGDNNDPTFVLIDNLVHACEQENIGHEDTIKEVVDTLLQLYLVQYEKDDFISLRYSYEELSQSVLKCTLFLEIDDRGRAYFRGGENLPSSMYFDQNSPIMMISAKDFIDKAAEVIINYVRK